MLKDVDVRESLGKINSNVSKISLSEYMQKALYQEQTGFYEQSDIEEHFVTPLNLNSGFLQFLVHQFFTSYDALLEIGPAHGRLVQEILSSSQAMRCMLFERSLLARTALASKFREFPQVQILNNLPKTFSGLIFLQEILDCQPANWYCYQEAGLFEYSLDCDFTIKKSLCSPLEKKDVFEYFSFLQEENELMFGDQFLFSAQGTELLNSLLRYRGASLLLIDYGYLSHDLLAANRLVKVPLRAYRQHQQVQDFWSMSGSCDLTYDVDFSWYLNLAVTKGAQVEFYGSLAHFIVNFLSDKAAYHTLLKPFLDPRQLGECFKVALIKL